MNKIKFFILVFVFLFISSSVLAEDVAYIVEADRDASQNVISQIQSLNLTYKLINKDRVTSTNFSSFKMIILSDGRISGVPVNSYKSLILNPSYNEGWSDDTGTTTSNSAYNLNHQITQGVPLDFSPYTQNGHIINYLTRKKYSEAVTVKSPSIVGRGNYIIAQKQNPRRVFFGISETDAWSLDSKKLFKNSIFWIINGYDKDGDGFYEERDCNDNNSSINQNMTEVPYDSIDNNCDGTDLIDVDMDGFIASQVGGPDCNDNNSLFNPNSTNTTFNCRNDAPTFSLIPNRINVLETQTAIINVVATDPEGDIINYSINDSRFNKEEINGTIRFSWVTQYEDFGNYLVKINVSDGLLSSSQDILVEVRNNNRAPGCLEIPDLEWDEDKNFILNLSLYCNDADGDVINYYFNESSLDENITLENLGQNSGVAEFTVRRDWYGVDWIKFKVSDSRNSSITNKINLKVRNVNDEPRYTGTERIYNITWVEDTNLTNRINLNNLFSDIDKDSLEFGVVGEANIEITINSAGFVSFFPKRDWFGSEIITFYATDGKSDLVYSNAINLTVVDTNEPPEFGQFNCELNILEDNSYSCEINATDVEGNDLDFSIIFENNIDCKINERNLSYTPSKDYFGPASCVIKVSDEFGGNEKIFNFSVGSVNDSPKIKSYSPINLSPKLMEGVSKIFSLDFIDVDGDDVKISWILNSSEVSNEEEYVFNKEKGSYNLEVIISDSNYNESVIWNILVGNISDFTCSEVSGFMCSEKEYCSVDYLGVKDSNVCCPVTCSIRPPEFNDAETCSIEGLNVSSTIDIGIKSPDNGEEFEPGETFNVEIRVKNNLEEEHDFEVYASLYDLTEDKEMKNEDDSISIESGKSELVEFEFEIPRDVGNNQHAIFVKVIEEDEISCNQNYTRIDVERKKDKVEISDADISPAIDLMCGDTFSLGVKVNNIGSNEQEDSYLIIENKELGIYLESDKFDLDKFDKKKDEREESFSFAIPKQVQEGEYKIDVTLYYDSENEKEKKSVDLKLKECNEERLVISNEPINLFDLSSGQVLGGEEKEDRKILESVFNSFNKVTSPFYDFLKSLDAINFFIVISIILLTLILFVVVLIRA